MKRAMSRYKARKAKKKTFKDRKLDARAARA